MLTNTTVDGIRIFNWYETIVYNNASIYHKAITPMGIQSFSLEYGHLVDGGLRNYTIGDGKTKVGQSLTLEYGRLGDGGLRNYTIGMVKPR